MKRCRFGRGSGRNREHGGASEEKAGEFPVCCCCGVLGGSGEAPKELGIAISALCGIESCQARQVRRSSS